MPIATLTIDIEARLARLEEGLNQVVRVNQKAANDVQQHWASAGSAIQKTFAVIFTAETVRRIADFVDTNARAVERLRDIGFATGSTIENISALQDVARRAGKDIEVAETALIKLNKALNESKPGSDAEKALTAIGLQASELKKLDPAEALLRVAKAFNNFADDGNKARLVQVLLNRSLAEAGPFLKDLAEQSKLVATRTREDAEQAERYVKALGEYDSAATAARQAIVLKLLPVFTDFIERINAAVAAHGGFWAALKAQNPIEAPPANAVEGLAKYRAELERLQAAIDKAASTKGGTPLADKLQIDANAARSRLPVVKQFIDYYERLLKLTDQAGAGRGFVNPPLPPKPSVGDPLGDANKEKKVRDASLTAEQIARLELEAEEQAAKDSAEAWDIWGKQRVKEWQDNADAVALMWKQVLDNIDKENEAHDERERTAAGIGFDKKQVDEMTEFAKQAARNIQDALGDTLKRTLKGDFESIGELWRNLLIDMAAEAAALQLSQFLFGKDKENPFLGGAIGAGLKWLGAFDTGTPFVPQDGLAMLHRGERVVPAAQNRAGGGFVFNQTVNVGSGVNRNDVALAMNVARQQAKADIADAMRRGSPVFG